MTVTLNRDQEALLQAAISAGRAQTLVEALDRALELLRGSLTGEHECSAESVRRLANFGKRHGLSLDGTTVKQLLEEGRF